MSSTGFMLLAFTGTFSIVRTVAYTFGPVVQEG